jgi:hypothetical protein
MTKRSAASKQRRASAEVEELREKQRKDFLAAVGELTLAFNGVDQMIVILVHKIVPVGAETAGIFVFSTSSYDSRIQMVEDLVEHRFLMWHPDAATKDDAAKMVEIFGRIKEKLKRVKRVRNTVAHGSLVFSADIQQTRLTPGFFDAMSRFRHERRNGKQPYGLSINDLNRSIQACDEARSLLSRFAFLAEKILSSSTITPPVQAEINTLRGELGIG